MGFLEELRERPARWTTDRRFIQCAFRGPTLKTVDTSCCGTVETFRCAVSKQTVWDTKCRTCMHYASSLEHKIEPFHNKHKGRRGFLLATGPSVAEQDISWLKDEIVVGVNFAHKITRPYGFDPTYMVCADYKLIPKLGDEYAELTSNIVLSDTAIIRSDYRKDNLVTKRGIPIHYNNKNPSWDCTVGANAPLCYSTTGHLAIPWALYLGLNPLYLLGCDCTARGHAYDDKGAWCQSAMELFAKGFHPGMASYRKATEAAGIQIYNATRGGNLDAFERVDFERIPHVRTA